MESNTISLYAYIFRTLPSLLLLLTDRRPFGLLPTHILAVGRARSPRHIIEVLTTCLLQFLLFIIHFVFLFYFK